MILRTHSLPRPGDRVPAEPKDCDRSRRPGPRLWLAGLTAAALLTAGEPARAEEPAPPPAPALAPAPPAAPSTPGPAEDPVPAIAPESNLPVLPARPALTPALPALRVLDETALVYVRDNRKQQVPLRVPLAIHRGANAFRLYGARPMTLQNRDRRRDLYRDALLELSTRAHLTPSTTAWDSLGKQWEWVRDQSPQFASRVRNGTVPAADADEAVRAILEATRHLSNVPGYRHLGALSRALGAGEPRVDVNSPVLAALRLRAVATDEAEQRLLALGRALELERPGTDPALRDGYRAAQAEFEQLREGLWPAVSAMVKRQQGRLLVSAVRELVLSHLGAWAIFGYVGWQGLESALNAEYHGQYAIALATVAGRLAENARRAPTHASLALYAEYALAFRLTEALKQGQVMPLKAAGGRGPGDWQIYLNTRATELSAYLHH
jgi:hypothetical protein